MANSTNQLPSLRGSQLPTRTIFWLVGLVIVGFVLFRFSSQFVYFFERVETEEVGVQFSSGRITNIVGPGVYNAVGLFVEMKRVSSQAVPFSVTDEEIITKDKQRIGVQVTGDIFRPRLDQADLLRQLWAQYNTLFLNDEVVQVRISDRAKQAMKVCVGDRTFDESVIGTARDDLRNCVDQELSNLATNFGLTIENVAIPEVIMAPEAQARLDEIVQSRLQTEKAAQDKLRADAQAAAEQARQEGEIRVAQSRIQEETRQQTLLAQLDSQKLEAQKAVIEAERRNELARVEAQRAIIEAEKSNDLLSAERDLEIQTARAAAAVEGAKAEVAVQKALAELYSQHPELLSMQMVQANASALRQTDKIIFVPEGTTPTLVLPGPGIVPTVDVGQ